MILVLHGAKKNAGDYLIRERGLDLLGYARSEQELVVLPRWLPLDPAMVEHADMIVLCGGPGLDTNFYPGRFPLVRDLDSISTPILPLALGWSGKPRGRPDEFSFDESSLAALRAIHAQGVWSAARDDISLEILERSAVGPTRRTGCVAWYHRPSLGLPFRPPTTIRRVVVTAPASARALPEATRVLGHVARRFRSCERTLVFHRGIRADTYTRRHSAAAHRFLQLSGRALGFSIVDASYGADAIAFYSEADLHVGYRVHAHLDFLSQRRASVLIAEDGRGEGQMATLGDPYRLRSRSRDLVGTLATALDNELGDYTGTRAAIDEIERTWPVMGEALEQVPA